MPIGLFEAPGRIAPLFTIPLLLAGCGGPAGQETGDSRSIPCGLRNEELSQSCLLEVEDRQGELRLTLRQPTGGFLRLVWPRGGQLAAADGAERLETMALNGGGVEARIGGWRYRIEKKGGGLP